MTALPPASAPDSPAPALPDPPGRDRLPEIDLRQTLALSDDTGILQHARFAAPDPHHGYCIDDNARALIAGLRLGQVDPDAGAGALPLNRYLAFCSYAFNAERGVFRNFLSYDRRWLEEEGSHDSQGRALWALGMAARLGAAPSVRELARNLFDHAVHTAERFEHLRSCAFGLLGLDHALSVEPDHGGWSKQHDALAERLIKAYHASAEPGWRWWEPVATYDNAKLPHALLCAGRRLGRADLTDAGLESLGWLLEQQTRRDSAGRPYLSVIGNDGWLKRGAPKADFDQQPLEAYALVDASLDAARITGEARWIDAAWMGLSWFLGRNDLGTPLVDPDTGGCRDGLLPTGPNRNQGAESVLAYLLSVLEMHRFVREQTSGLAVSKTHTGASGPLMTHPTTPEVLGLGIAGASGFAAFCLEAWRPVKGLRPVRVWSRSAASAARLAERFGLDQSDSLEAMYADPAIDLVHVAGVPSTHGAQARAALEAGKHVLVEKPMAVEADDALGLLDAAATRDRVLMVHHMMRYGPLAEPVRRMVASGALGAVLRVQVTNRAGDAGLANGHWFWDRSLSGGILVEHGVHFFDLVAYLLDVGPGEAVSAWQAARPGAEVIDQVGCEAVYGGRVRAGFYHTFSQAPSTDRQDVRLICERGQVILEGWVARRLRVEAAVSNEQLEQILSLLPEGVSTAPLQTGGLPYDLRRRGKAERVEQAVGIDWQDPRDDGTVYRSAAAGLMQDMLQAVSTPGHRTRSKARQAYEALRTALDARRLAERPS
ncbi:MAG: Gfo/Idh/MocA family oxidoreductase [Planctomycetota bacterium]